MVKEKVHLDKNRILGSEDIEYNNGILKNHLDKLGVIESGSNADGSYIKFSDGTMICTKIISGISEKCISWVNVFYTDVINGNWPITFTEVKNVQVTNDTNQFWCMISDVTEKSAGTTRLIRPDSYGQTYNIEIFAIGKWK